MNVLFLCTGNSCRSIIAEALFNYMAPSGLSAQSAGSNPTGIVNQRALLTLRNAGIDTQNLHSKSWDNLKVKPDVVITLCADAAGEACPVFLDSAMRLHWGMPDPAKVNGDESTIGSAFDKTFNMLKKRISAFLKIVKTAAGFEREQLKKTLEDIGTIQ